MKKVEIHKGKIIQVDPDFTEVELRNPTGHKYRRYFETAFLGSCGITSAGEEFKIAFRVWADGKKGRVTMYVSPTGKRVEPTEEELAKIFTEVDLSKIAAAFGRIQSEEGLA